MVWGKGGEAFSVEKFFLSNGVLSRGHVPRGPWQVSWKVPVQIGVAWSLKLFQMLSEPWWARKLESLRSAANLESFECVTVKLFRWLLTVSKNFTNPANDFKTFGPSSNPSPPEKRKTELRERVIVPICFSSLCPFRSASSQVEKRLSFIGLRRSRPHAFTKRNGKKWKSWLQKLHSCWILQGMLYLKYFVRAIVRSFNGRFLILERCSIDLSTTEIWN